MYSLVGALFLLIAVASIGLAAWRPGVLSIFVATMGLFSCGYYALPLLAPDLAGLASLPSREINAVALMALLYMACIIASLALTSWLVRDQRGFRLSGLDRLAQRHWWATTLGAAALYLTYILTTNLTSYAASDLDAYYAQRSPIAAIAAFFSGLALATLAVNFAACIRDVRWARIAVMLLLFGFIEARLLGGAQRLLFITPIFMIFVSLVGMSQYRIASGALAAGVAALLVISPIAVALRESRTGGTNNQLTSTSVSYHKGFVATTLQSIADRADLIYNMTYLKPYVDSHGFVGPRYYVSVLVIPIPRAIFPDKPYVLSDTGTALGEASVLAWNIIVGKGVGSLTAFGSIVAYRQGGWPMVIVDGLAAGALFALTLTFLSRGGFAGRVFFALAFVSFTVAKVPTSFFEALAQVMTYLPVLLGLWLVDAALSWFVPAAPRRRSAAPSVA